MVPSHCLFLNQKKYFFLFAKMFYTLICLTIGNFVLKALDFISYFYTPKNLTKTGMS